VQGIRSAGVTAQKSAAPRADEEAGQAARDKAEVDELKARAASAPRQRRQARRRRCRW